MNMKALIMLVAVTGSSGILASCAVEPDEDEWAEETLYQESVAGLANVHWATLFEHENGGGSRVNIVGPAPCGGPLVNLPDLNFNDRTTSVRVVGQSCFIELFEHINGGGLRVQINFNGGAVQNVTPSFNDRASSVR